MRGIVGKSINLSGPSQLQCACNHLACFTSLAGLYISPTLVFQFLEHSQNFSCPRAFVCTASAWIAFALACGMGGFILTFGCQLFLMLL